jgi:TRAP-type C4-dicarboxylate transport system permease small subunit
MDRKPPIALRIGKVLLNIVELYVPMAAFVMLFLLFIVNIFFRYALNNPLTWPFELIVSGFVWLAILSATYVRRVGGHVKFTITYDRMSPLMQTLSRIVVNVIIAVLFAIAIPATWSWVNFMAFKGTTNLRIPFMWVYFPTVPFLVLIIGHSVYDVVVDIRHLVKHNVRKDEEPPEVRA